MRWFVYVTVHAMLALAAACSAVPDVAYSDRETPRDGEELDHETSADPAGSARVGRTPDAGGAPGSDTTDDAAPPPADPAEPPEEPEDPGSPDPGSIDCSCQGAGCAEPGVCEQCKDRCRGKKHKCCVSGTGASLRIDCVAHADACF